ncbi:MAG: hypothetical protein M3P98_02355 [bacterium]|nr:hypothetical protein [bacterium]
MSEAYNFETEFAVELNQRLDEVLPFEPYEPSRLDHALIAEEFLNAKVRWNHMWDVIDDEAITSNLVRDMRFCQIYKQFYPGASSFCDDRLLRQEEQPNIITVGSWVLANYGSMQASNDEHSIGVATGEFNRSLVVTYCLSMNMTQAQALTYLNSARIFMDELFEIDFISEDKLLKEPFITFGSGLVGAIFSDEEQAKVKADWAVFLKENIGKVNLLGENGEVLDDTVYYLTEWANICFTYYKALGSFPDQTKNYFGEEYFDYEVETSDFAAFGTDATYFEEVRRIRLAKEVAEAEKC